MTFFRIFLGSTVLTEMCPQTDFVDILVAVIANRADMIPGFENISEVLLREHLRQTIQEVCV